jgi:hypothetical protein
MTTVSISSGDPGAVSMAWAWAMLIAGKVIHHPRIAAWPRFCLWHIKAQARAECQPLPGDLVALGGLPAQG